MKKCTKCKIKKLEKEFNKNNQSKDGLSYYCKKCLGKCTKKWRDSLSEKQKKQRREQRREYQKNYYLTVAKKRRKNKTKKGK